MNGVADIGRYLAGRARPSACCWPPSFGGGRVTSERSGGSSRSASDLPWWRTLRLAGRTRTMAGRQPRLAGRADLGAGLGGGSASGRHLGWSTPRSANRRGWQLGRRRSMLPTSSGEASGPFRCLETRAVRRKPRRCGVPDPLTPRLRQRSIAAQAARPEANEVKVGARHARERPGKSYPRTSRTASRWESSSSRKASSAVTMLDCTAEAGEAGGGRSQCSPTHTTPDPVDSPSDPGREGPSAPPRPVDGASGSHLACRSQGAGSLDPRRGSYRALFLRFLCPLLVAPLAVRTTKGSPHAIHPMEKMRCSSRSRARARVHRDQLA